VNFLRRFIANLSSKLIPFTLILRLKNEAKFTWGAKQQAAFDQIKHYLSTPPVLRAPKSGELFRLYIVAQEDVQIKNFHIEAKSMLGGEKILLYIELDCLTATPAGLTTTQTGQTAT
jgi:hypothetical protein